MSSLIPRVTPIDPPYSAEVQAAFDVVMRGAPPLTLFRSVARNPRVMQRMMAGGLLDRGSIPIRLRELMILRTTARCGAEYEWGVHVAAFAAKSPWTAEELHAGVHADAGAGCWNPEESLTVRLADALHERHDIDDALWADLRKHFADDQLIELIMLAGLYHAVSYLVNGLRIPHEAFAPRFPPEA
ncbi:MAG: carboxymuconolactone decarboxylase family protein [Pseudomonadota bacterium]|nr:carboxymuconolactone decarboxylase family protein [Pseudomonadota bacterium]